MRLRRARASSGAGSGRRSGSFDGAVPAPVCFTTDGGRARRRRDARSGSGRRFRRLTRDALAHQQADIASIGAGRTARRGPLALASAVASSIAHNRPRPHCSRFSFAPERRLRGFAPALPAASHLDAPDDIAVGAVRDRRSRRPDWVAKLRWRRGVSAMPGWLGGRSALLVVPSAVVAPRRRTSDPTRCHPAAGRHSRWSAESRARRRRALTSLIAASATQPAAAVTSCSNPRSVGL